MSDGTTIEVYVPRLHRSNARDVLQDAEHTQRYCRDRLLALAASQPHNVAHDTGMLIPWDQYVVNEIDDILEAVSTAVWQQAMASRVVECPSDCHDDFDSGRSGL